MIILKRESYKQNELDQLHKFTQWAIEFMADEMCNPYTCEACQFKNLCRDITKLHDYLENAKPIKRR